MIKVGDEVTQNGWNKYYKVVKVENQQIYLVSPLTGRYHGYSTGEPWIIKQKPKSGFSNWIKKNGL